ncbi:UNVERIFIED_CONTAM: hypothetical protein RMT77_015584 [Armadillidium vulgare]
MAWVHYGRTGSAVLSVCDQVLTTNNRVSVISERNTWILVITNSTVKDRGQYMCQISTVPPKKMYGTLHVQVPPEITTPPKDVTVKEGENATLECEAKGDPTPHITWRREANGNGEVHGRNLTLYHVTREDADAFLCVASNGVPPAVSARAQIIVLYSPMIAVDTQVTNWAPKGTRIELVCKFWSMPQPEVLWYPIGREHNHKFKVENEFHSNGRGVSKLIIEKIDEKDFGTFRCSVRNTFGRSDAIFYIFEKVTLTSTTTTPQSSPATTSSVPPGASSTEATLKKSISFSKSSSIDRIIRRYLGNQSLRIEDFRTEPQTTQSSTTTTTTDSS